MGIPLEKGFDEARHSASRLPLFSEIRCRAIDLVCQDRVTLSFPISHLQRQQTTHHGKGLAVHSAESWSSVQYPLARGEGSTASPSTVRRWAVNPA